MNSAKTMCCCVDLRRDRRARSQARIPADARLTAAHFRYATDAARFVVDPDVPPGLPFQAHAVHGDIPA